MGMLDLERLGRGLADELGEVSVTAQGDWSVFARGPTEFARMGAEALEVRLPPDIAEAATRTPDTASMAEPGWVRFAPGGDERHVTDRAEAWFRTAWRYAGPR